MLNWKATLLGAAFCLVTTAPTFAQTVGNVNLVKVWAYGRDSGNANWVDLYQSDPVLMAQALRTPIGGAMHVRFTDDTDLRLGSEAEIVVDRFVFNPSTGVGALQAEIGKGVLRFTHHCDIVETGNESWRFKNRSERTED